MIRHDAACGRCGTRGEEWIDPETKREWLVAPYIVETDRCPGCERLAAARKMAGEAEHVNLRLTRNPEFDPLDDLFGYLPPVARD